ncbi:MAG: type II CAAX endopeptidase family protein [Myxococcota bacterium]
MFPYEPPEDEGPDPNEPYPGVGASLVLLVMAMIASVFTAIALLGLGDLAAQGLGRAIGFGAVASMAIQRIPPPHALRLGLQRLEPQAIPLILCLVPAVFLMSELDNYAYDWAPDEPSLLENLAPPVEGTQPASETDAAEATPVDADEEEGTAEADAARRLIDPENPWSVLQGLILITGLVPLIDGFFFFGVLQQGLVRKLGLFQGVFFTGLFWMLVRDYPITGATRFVVATLSLTAMGWLLGMVRTATGTVLGPILLSSGWAAIGFVSGAYSGAIDWPGMNVEGTHLPFTLVLGSIVLVAWATSTVVGEAQRRHDVAVAQEGPPDGRRTRTNVHELRPPIDDDDLDETQEAGRRDEEGR